MTNTETKDKDGQSFGTDGIAPMERPSAVTRFFMGLVNWAEKLNLKHAIHGNPRSMTMRPSHGRRKSRRQRPPSAPNSTRCWYARANCRVSRISRLT
nr:hypothetical protein [Marinicella sp. W31]MDC2877890.1 hypothetical protein [Marinicella sp. W31]